MNTAIVYPIRYISKILDSLRRLSNIFGYMQRARVYAKARTVTHGTPFECSLPSVNVEPYHGDVDKMYDYAISKAKVTFAANALKRR